MPSCALSMIRINMPIQNTAGFKLCKIKQQIFTLIYFQYLLGVTHFRVFSKRFKAYKLQYVVLILSSLHQMHLHYQEHIQVLSCVLCTGVLVCLSEFQWLMMTQYKNTRTQYRLGTHIEKQQFHIQCCTPVRTASAASRFEYFPTIQQVKIYGIKEVCPNSQYS